MRGTPLPCCDPQASFLLCWQQMPGATQIERLENKLNPLGPVISHILKLPWTMSSNHPVANMLDFFQQRASEVFAQVRSNCHCKMRDLLSRPEHVSFYSEVCNTYSTASAMEERDITISMHERERGSGHACFSPERWTVSRSAASPPGPRKSLAAWCCHLTPPLPASCPTLVPGMRSSRFPHP
jgi:hypothetical protein